jgi:hypothetical protein
VKTPLVDFFSILLVLENGKVKESEEPNHPFGKLPKSGGCT